MYKEVFAPRLKMAREYNGLTQRDISKLLKIANSTYASYELGRTEPNLQSLAMLSKLLDVTSDWLIGLSSESKIGSLAEAKAEKERQKLLQKMEKEIELNKRLWG